MSLELMYREYAQYLTGEYLLVYCGHVRLGMWIL
jgi:hypothetical protein